MSEQPISPLRRRMIEDMSVRNFAQNRQAPISRRETGAPETSR